MKLPITSLEDLKALIPTSVESLLARIEEATPELKKSVAAIIAIPDDQRTWANTGAAYDNLVNSPFMALMDVASLIKNVTTNDALRAAAIEQTVKMAGVWLDVVENNIELYHAMKAYIEGNARTENLRPDQQYFLQEAARDFKRKGLDLPAPQREEIKRLQKELVELTSKFDDNIAADASFITVTRADLEGLDDQFIATLKQDDKGNYKVTVDTPTYLRVMENCNVPQTRKKLFLAFQNRAYPANEELFKQIIGKRDELAKILGFDSYAHLEIDAEMAQTPERVKAFVDNVWNKATKKEKQEYQQFIKDLPASVELTKEGKFQPWDLKDYVTNQYKKKHYNLDEQKIAEYFPVHHTLHELLDIYEQFLSLRFEHIAATDFWHPDVQLIAAYDKETNKLLGYLFLDLYPRPFKFSHACQIGVLPALKSEDGSTNIAVLVVLANFPKSTATQPALLTYHDVNTFFHEFGHAMHSLLGRTYLASQSGTRVKLDFVEMPSQMLENWLYNKEILKKISKHYVTGEPLPNDIIERLIKVKTFNSGFFYQRQAMLANLALAYYLPGVIKDPAKVFHDIDSKYRPDIQFNDADHMYANFGHLMGYGARYYGYLWSLVFALDMFDKIKKQGLLNPVVGREYIDKVLAKGGSENPDDLLRDFLGREPNDKAFFADLGL